MLGPHQNYQKCQNKTRHQPRYLIHISYTVFTHLLQSFLKNTNSPDIAAKYQSNYYFMRTTANTLQSHVGVQYFPLFIQLFAQSPSIKKHLPAPPQESSSSVPTSTPTNTIFEQNALTLRNNYINMIHSLPERSHYRIQLLSALVQEIPTADCTELFN